LVLRGEFEQVTTAAFITPFFGGCLGELVRAVAVSAGATVGGSIGHSLVPFPKFSDWSENS
jgi:hypothetical protein